MVSGWLEALSRRIPGWLRTIGLLLAVGMLIEFLPIDLAVVAVLVAATHASIASGMLLVRVRRWVGKPAPTRLPGNISER